MKKRVRQTKERARRVAGYDRAVARDGLKKLLGPRSPLRQRTAPGDARTWGGVVEPKQTAAGFGLALCDPAALLKPSEKAELERDVIKMMDGRRDAEATSETIRLA